MEPAPDTQPNDQRGFTLTDFVNAWVRRWPIFGVIVLVFLIAGFFSFRSRPLEPFIYRTTVEIGSNARGVLFESADSIKAKFRESYIPEMLAAHADEHAYLDQRYEVEIVEPDIGAKSSGDGGAGSNTIALLSRGGMSAKQDILGIHQRIVDRYIQDQEQHIATATQSLEQQKLHAALERETFEDAIAGIPKRRTLVDVRAVLLAEQLESAQATIRTFEADRSRAIAVAASSTGVDQSLATTFLLLDSNLLTMREESRNLEEQLSVQVPTEYAALDAELEGLKRDLRVSDQTIADIAYQIMNFHAPRVLLAPSQLPRPPLSGALSQTLAIFGGIGFILGLFLVAFVEFVVQVRREARRK